MDDETGQEESCGSGTFEVNSPYQSEDSRFSVDSYASNEYPMDVNSSDWADESSFETAEYIGDLHYESLGLALEDSTPLLFPPRREVNPTIEEEISVETLEENNNDPNNNMDSNEITNIDEGSTLMEHSSGSSILLDRSNSPKPGCSKDSLPVLGENESNLTEEIIQGRTQRVKQLILSIDTDSISDAIRQNPKIRINDLKLSDLVPAHKRLNHPEAESVEKISEVAESIVTERDITEAGSSLNDDNRVAITSKRGPVEDICTIGCKKASSNPDIAILLPKLPAPSSISKSSSQIPVFVRKNYPVTGKAKQHSLEKLVQQDIPLPVPQPKVVTEVVTIPDHSKGAIPKVRTEPQKQRAQQRQPSELPNISPEVLNVGTAETLRRSPNSDIRTTSGNIVGNPDSRGLNSANPQRSILTNITIAVPTTAQNNVSYQQPTNRTICKEMYYKLRGIFPNVDPKYLKKLCPPEWGPGDRDAQVTPIVEFLLSKGDDLPPAPEQFREDTAATNGTAMVYGNVDDIYENLLGIFPDADPHYLREFAEKNVSKPNAIKEFVEQKLESRDYPTREQYQARLKITEQQRQYTTGFNVQQYLTIIPDPFTYFMNIKRKCQHSTVAFEFLKTYFSKIKVTTITRIYRQYAYNLSASAEALEATPAEMKSKRFGYEVPTENITLLQEIAFIKHKDEIKEYIDNKKRAEEAEFKMMKENNFLVECECCYDSECLPSKCSTCVKGHLFCNNCIITGTNTKLGEGETRIECFLNCGSEISLSTLQQVLAPTTFSILLKKRQAAEVMEAGLEGLVACPFCNFASIPPEEDKIFKCLNPECTKESCRLCKELSHVPLKCDEVLKADKARHFIEESMTAALARKCYKCQRAFFKEEGCNKIQCPCGALMCYLCDQPIKNYSHFRGQGSNDQNLCPLYSDTIRLDAVAVRKIAEEAQMEVLKRNPNMKIDTSKLLPNIPNRTNGPHTTVLNADEMPRRTQRVLDLNPL
ncbi:uncharacterized protein [Venturia canescens]|uniref:uncharacterized protein n=1 Tax=Venturia canescens TaxID=32260 RepID=UPI001C9D3B41|nr:uncharacterized protein LOC122412602 [Venturia canescens]